MTDPPDKAGPSNKDSGKALGTEAWHLQQEIRGQRKEHGATISAEADEKIRRFTISVTIREKVDEDAPLVNLYKSHKGFVTKLFELTQGDAHLIPTAYFEPEDDDDADTRSPIVSADSFPATDRLHRLFFRRQFDYKERSTTIRIHHSVHMKETTKDVKEKLLDYLQEHSLWMHGGDLLSIETSNIGWLLGAHHTMVYRPAIVKRLNDLVATLPKRVIAEQIELHGGSEDDAKKLPTLFVNKKLFHFGIENSRVSTQALAVTCVKNRVRLMKELLALIPESKMPFPFIPMGMATITSVADYKKLMILNNDKQNELQGITVKGFSAEILDYVLTYDNDEMDEGNQEERIPVHKFFTDHKSIVSIEPTYFTPSQGRFIFIVYQSTFLEAKEVIENFCNKTFKIIYDTFADREAYKRKYGSYPKVLDSASAGGAVASLSARLCEMLKSTESTGGKTLSTAPTTWAQRAAPRMIFEKNSHFPDLGATKNKSTTTSNPPPAASVESNSASSSLSTVAKQAIPSSNLTAISQDMVSVVSDMRTFMSEQSELVKRLMDRQDRQDDRQDRQDAIAEKIAQAAEDAAKEARNAAQKTAEANQALMDRMITLMERFQPPPQPTPNHATQLSESSSTDLEEFMSPASTPVKPPAAAPAPLSKTKRSSTTRTPVPPPPPNKITNPPTPSTTSTSDTLSTSDSTDLSGGAHPRSAGNTPSKEPKKQRTQTLDPSSNESVKRNLFQKDGTKTPQTPESVTEEPRTGVG